MVLPSACDEDFASAFAQLLASAPSYLQNAVREGRSVTHYFCIHDATEYSSVVLEKTEKAMKLLNSLVGPAGHVITINSQSMPKADSKFWESLILERSSKSSSESEGVDLCVNLENLSHSVSCDDFVSIKVAIEEMTTRKAALFVESRIRMLDSTILAQRRGIRNQLRSFLFRKSTSSLIGVSDGGNSYNLESHDAIKSWSGLELGVRRQISVEHFELRQLADLLVMIGDLETAMVTLKLLAVDFKNDKSYFDYAGIQEAMAAVAVLSDGLYSDAVAYFKESYYRYSQVASQLSEPNSKLVIRYATRSAIIGAGFLSSISRYTDASWILMKSHFQEEDLRAALLLEEAANLLLLATPPRLRKYAFHLVLAGLRYSKAGALTLASYSYRDVLSIYQNQGWDLIEEHVREAIGRYHMETGDFAASSQEFAAAFCLENLPAHRQQLQLENCIESLANISKCGDVIPSIELPVPYVNGRHAKVSLPGQASFGNQEAQNVSKDVWNRLEERVIFNQIKQENGKLSGFGSRANLVGLNMESCCVGEDIIVEIEMYNFLNIPIKLTEIILRCAWSSSSNLEQDESDYDCSSEYFVVEEEDMDLDAGVRVIKRLKVRPLRAGYLRIHSVTWRVNGISGGCIPLFSTHKSKKEKSFHSFVESESKNNGIVVKIVDPMPCLEVTFCSMPLCLMAGQTRKCRILVKNIGSVPLQNLRVATDSRSIYIPTKDVFDFEGLTSFAIPGTVARLGVEESRELMVYIRFPLVGNLILNLCWYYEPDTAAAALPFRVLCTSYNASVSPSISLRSRIMVRRGTDTRRLLLEQKISSMDEDVIYNIKQIELIDGEWFFKVNKNENEDLCKTLHLAYDVRADSPVAIHNVLFCKEQETDEQYVNNLDAEEYFIASEVKRFKECNLDLSRDNLNAEIHGILRWDAVHPENKETVTGFEVFNAVNERTDAGVFAELLLPNYHIDHDFEIEACCFVNFELVIVNRSRYPLQIKWGTSSAERNDEVNVTNGVIDGSSYNWCGLTSGTIPVLQSKERYCVKLCVAVRSAGWIDINSCWVDWKIKDFPTEMVFAWQHGSLVAPPLRFYVGSKN